MDFSKFLESGRTLLVDTKTRGPSVKTAKGGKKAEKAKAPPAGPTSDNPYDIFVHKAIHEKMKPKDMIERMQKFIDAEEAQL